jgi:hypothetical protein
MKKFFVLLMVILMTMPIFAQMWVSTNGQNTASVSAKEIVGWDIIQGGIRSQATWKKMKKDLDINLSNQFILGTRPWQHKQNSKISFDFLAGSGISFGSDKLEMVTSLLGVFQFRKIYFEMEAIQNWGRNENILKIGLGLDLEIFMF